MTISIPTIPAIKSSIYQYQWNLLCVLSHVQAGDTNTIVLCVVSYAGR